ncbi:MAG TPA: DegT/DnrJ/EryC1/StrS family aminotransferase [Nocardioidaceae bacterium]|nr:DegT/DnrJ/EryC1/StrS family aminotransferase [Nocardioidaceae bacterium]
MPTHDVAFHRPLIAPEAQLAARCTLESGWLTTGPECARFEVEFGEWVGAEHAVAVSSCTAGLELSVRALHLDRGAKVLVPDITFCGAAEAITHAGLTPVLVDVDPVTGMVTPETCAEAAQGCSGASAMMALHFAGYPAPVAELADAAGVPLTHVVEDAAHGLGTWVGDQQVGSISQATVFSFYATKNLPIGEGGMVTTDDPELADWVRRARLHGMSKDSWKRYLPGGSWRYTVEEAGLKANLSDLQAAIGRAQLNHLDTWQLRRAELAALYNERLRDVPGLELPPVPTDGLHAWHLYVVRIHADFGPSRDEVADRLSDAGIGVSVHFIPLHIMPWFKTNAVAPTSLHGAELVFTQTLSLPMYPSLTNEDVDAVCDALLHCRVAS